MPPMIKVSPHKVQAGKAITPEEKDFVEFAKARHFSLKQQVCHLSEVDPTIPAPPTAPFDTITSYETDCVLVPMSAPPGYASEEARLGYGVHYQGKTPIKPDSIVMYYTGILGNTDAMQNDYCHEVPDTPWSIDAEKHGNMARFIAHLPTIWEVAMLVMPRSMRTQVALANLNSAHFNVNNYIGVRLHAITEIQPEELLGVSYNINYFLGRGCLPFLYTKTGQPLPMDQVYLDKRRFLILHIFQKCLGETDRQFLEPLKPLLHSIGLCNTLIFSEFELKLKEHFSTLYDAMEACFTKNDDQSMSISLNTLEAILLDPDNPLTVVLINLNFSNMFPLATDPKKFSIYRSAATAQVPPPPEPHHPPVLAAAASQKPTVPPASIRPS